MIAEYSKPTSQKTPAIVVIGIGNSYRRDDAVGLLVARELRKHLRGEVPVFECRGASLELIDLWTGADLVILVDAVSSGADPGTIFRIEPRNQPIPSCLFHYSTHGFNLADTIELARLVGLLPPKITVFGIEGADFGQGERLSEDVALALERVTHSVLDFINYTRSHVKEDEK